MAIKNTPTFVIKDPLKATPDLPNIPQSIKNKAAEKVAQDKGTPTLQVESTNIQPKGTGLTAQDMQYNGLNTAKQRSDFLGALNPEEVQAVQSMNQQGKTPDYITSVIAAQRRIQEKGGFTPEDQKAMQNGVENGLDTLDILHQVENNKGPAPTPWDNQETIGGKIGHFFNSEMNGKNAAQQVTSPGLSAIRGILDLGNNIRNFVEGTSDEEKAKRQQNDDAIWNKILGNPSLLDQIGRIAGQTEGGFMLAGNIGGGLEGLSTPAKLGVTALEGGIGTQAVSLGEKGDFATPIETVIGSLFPTLFEAATPLIGRLSSRIELKNLMTPAKLSAIKDKLIQAGENIDEIGALNSVEDVGKWMTQRGFKGSRRQLVDQLTNWYQDSKGTVDSLLKGSTQLYKNKYADNALKLLKKEYSMPSSSAAEEKLTTVNKLIRKSEKGGLGLDDINNIKRMVGEDLNPFTASGKVKIAKSDQGALYNDLKTFIEKEADKAGLGNIKMLNNETTVAYSLSKAIAQKEASEEAKNFLGKTFNLGASFLFKNSVGGALGAYEGYKKGGSLEDAVIGGIVGEIANKALRVAVTENPYITTRIANILSKLSGAERISLQNWVGGKGTLPKSLVEKLSNQIGDELGSALTDYSQAPGLPYRKNVKTFPEQSSLQLPKLRNETIVSTPYGNVRQGGEIVNPAIQQNMDNLFGRNVVDESVPSAPRISENSASKVANPEKASTIDSMKTEVLNNLNPTGGLYVDYTPGKRATMPLGENMTTLDKTSGKSPDTEVTIYRGAPKSQKSIVPGDYVTTNYDLAKSYNGDGNVISMKVKMSDVLDDVTEPLGEEYIYRPSKGLPVKADSMKPNLIEEAKK